MSLLLLIIAPYRSYFSNWSVTKLQFFRVIVLIKLRFRSSRLYVNAALILRSFGEAHLRRVHVSTHILTQAHSNTPGASLERRERSFWFDNLEESLYLYILSRLITDCL